MENTKSIIFIRLFSVGIKNLGINWKSHREKEHSFTGGNNLGRRILN